MSTITKGVITAAGLGTRLLPATKNVSKEMLPILNKPMIHYVVEQFVEAGILEIIIVVDENSSVIQDYFTIDPDLVAYLKAKNKLKFIQEIQDLCARVKFQFVTQDTSLPYGNARPLYSVRHLLGDEPFVYMYGDGIMFGPGAGVIELVQHFEKNPSQVVLTATEVTPEQMTSLGMIRLKPGSNMVVQEVIEKPKPEQINSNLATVCSYVFDQSIFAHLDPSQVPSGQEFQVQDAINKLINNGNVTVCRSKGKFLTNGDVPSYLEMFVELALARPYTREEFFKILHRKIEALGDLLK
jgi:UTP--glucose-1-phosphate uridylyltransferase